MGRRVAVHCDVRDAGNREGGLGSGHARGKGMSGAGTGPLSIGIIWGIVGTAKYWGLSIGGIYGIIFSLSLSRHATEHLLPLCLRLSQFRWTQAQVREPAADV